MKDLLYLKDEQLKEFIEELFISYRESFGDAKKTLEKYSLGIAHHKVIHIISINDGITISNLLKKLKVTKQSLNRILNDLIKFDQLFIGCLNYFKTSRCSSLGKIRKLISTIS